MTISIKKALVTGGAGFIGSHIVDALLAAKCEVTVLDNLSTGKLSNLTHVRDLIRFIEGDVRDKTAVMNASKGCQVIFHEAAVVSVPQTIKEPVESAMVNDIGTLSVLEAARYNEVKRTILASSCAIYGDDPRLPKIEEMSPKPMSPYAIQKYTGELNAYLYHTLYGVETVSLRYFNVFGPRQDPSSPYSGVISIFLTCAMAHKAPTVYGDGCQSRDFVFVDDVVSANLLSAAVEGISGERFNIGTGRSIEIKQLWDDICQVSGIQISPNYVSERPGDIRHSLADITRAGERIGFFPRYTFKEGLALTSEWYQNTIPN